MRIKVIIQLGVLSSLIFLMGACKALFEQPIDAETAYETKQYALAADLLKVKYEEESDLIKKADIAYKIAESYRGANKTKSAEQWYVKALNYSLEPTLLYRYAQTQKRNGNYAAAMQTFKEYAANNPVDRTRALRAIQACKQALSWKRGGTNYQVANQKDINTPAIDFAPVLYGEDQMVFTSSREDATGKDIYGWTGDKFFDLFVAKRIDERRFSAAVQFGDSINTPWNEGTATFDGEFKEMYFTACGSKNQVDDYCKIYWTFKRDNGKWAVPRILDLFGVDTVNVDQPYLTSDGSQLYFASDAGGGYGSKDLYVVDKGRDGFWSEPTNLGPEINTSHYEGFPHIGPNGKFYFASDGHLGMGGLDLFEAELNNKNDWTNPINMQSPINSEADDFALIFEPNVLPEYLDKFEAWGFLSSSRKGGQGADDIYRFVLNVPPPEPEPEIPVDTPKIVVVDTPKTPVEPPKPVITYVLKGRLLQKELADPNNPNSREIGTKPIPNAVAEILGISANSSLYKRVVSDEQGNFEIAIEADSDYKITGTQAGFLRKSKNASSKGRRPQAGSNEVVVYVELMLDKIYKQQNINITQLGLQPVYYDLSKWNIRPDAELVLNRLAEILFENGNIVLELGSHTDARGGDDTNQALSQKRAQSAIDYLVNKGINRARLRAKGYGETQLVNGCDDSADCTEDEHQQNRRTTFKIVSDSYSGF